MGTGPGEVGVGVWAERRDGWAPTPGDKHTLSGGLLGAGSLPGARKGTVSVCRAVPHPEQTHYQKGPWQSARPGEEPLYILGLKVWAATCPG